MWIIIATDNPYKAVFGRIITFLRKTVKECSSVEVLHLRLKILVQSKLRKQIGSDCERDGTGTRLAP